MFSPATTYCTTVYSAVIPTIAQQFTARVWASPAVARISLCRTPPLGGRGTPHIHWYPRKYKESWSSGNLNYINIDILDHKEKQLDYQGCLAINAGDNNLIRNVRFENIRIEDFRQGQLVNLRIFFNEKYCTAPGRGIETFCSRTSPTRERMRKFPWLSAMTKNGKWKTFVSKT